VHRLINAIPPRLLLLQLLLAARHLLAGPGDDKQTRWPYGEQTQLIDGRATLRWTTSCRRVDCVGLWRGTGFAPDCRIALCEQTGRACGSARHRAACARMTDIRDTGDDVRESGGALLRRQYVGEQRADAMCYRRLLD